MITIINRYVLMNQELILVQCEKCEKILTKFIKYNKHNTLKENSIRLTILNLQ